MATAFAQVRKSWKNGKERGPNYVELPQGGDRSPPVPGGDGPNRFLSDAATLKMPAPSPNPFSRTLLRTRLPWRS